MRFGCHDIRQQRFAHTHPWPRSQCSFPAARNLRTASDDWTLWKLYNSDIKAHLLNFEKRQVVHRNLNAFYPQVSKHMMGHPFPMKCQFTLFKCLKPCELSTWPGFHAPEMEQENGFGWSAGCSHSRRGMVLSSVNDNWPQDRLVWLPCLWRHPATR